jgi:hypothetical protein
VVNQLNLHSSLQTSRDENLEAKIPGGGGRVKVEAGGATGAHNLEATDDAIQ